MTSSAFHPTLARGDHTAYMNYALSQARHAPKLPTNFRVGAVLVDADKNQILSTGHSLELEGNTHAEQCCFIKLAQQHGLESEDELLEHAPLLRNKILVLYTTMEPCNKRLSGNLPCVDRILRLGKAIKTVYVGIMEPETFVGQNMGRKRLVDAGITFDLVEGLDEEIRRVATAGHGEEIAEAS